MYINPWSPELEHQITADASLNPKMILSGLRRLMGPVSKHIHGKVERFPLFSRCIVWVANNIIWMCFDGDFFADSATMVWEAFFSTTLSKSQFCDYMSTPSHSITSYS